MKKLAVLCLAVVFVAGCNAQTAAQKVSSYIVAILNIGQAEEAALPPNDAAIMTPWIQLGFTLDMQTNTCIAASGNTKTKLASCFLAFSVGLLSPTELTQLRLLSPATQRNVQIVATAANIAINALLADWSQPAVATPTIAEGPATPAEMRTFSARLEAMGYAIP